MISPRRSRLKAATRTFVKVGEIFVDFVELAVESLRTVSSLRRKNRSINVGDMVVVRMDSSRRFASRTVGRTGIVVFRDSNPLWSKYCILISGERHCLSIDEIEKFEGA